MKTMLPEENNDLPGAENKKPASTASENWIDRLHYRLSGTNQTAESRLTTTLQCKTVGNDFCLLVPPELAEYQPEILEYLHSFASEHSLTLIEDRRDLALAPIIDRRSNNIPDMAMAVSSLLKQAGLPGPVPQLSSPHRLRAGGLKIDCAKLIRMAQGVNEQSRKVAIIPQPFIRQRLMQDDDSLTVSACQLRCSQPAKLQKITPSSKINGSQVNEENDEMIIFAHFESPNFHAIGYTSASQFVVTVYLAGGSLLRPEIWASQSNLAENPFHCQIFSSPYPEQDCGLLYRTYYFDLEETIEQIPAAIA